MNIPKLLFRSCASFCLLASAAAIASAQYEGELTAKRRVFPEVGAGLRAIKCGDSDKTYVLSSQGLLVFDAKDHKLLTIGSSAADIPASKTSSPGSTAPGQSFAEDFDVDAAGQVYVADRAANLIVEYSAEGNRLKSFHVNAPLSVAALPDGEVAVTTLHDRRLIVVFDKNGTEVRDFG
jgi:DNA-binding beta-propeller fold protein YncE